MYRAVSVVPARYIESKAAVKTFFHKKIPLWLTILGFGLIAALAGVALFEFRQIVYNYSFNLPGNDWSVAAYVYGSWPRSITKIFTIRF